MDHAGRRKSVHDNFLAMFKTKFNLDPTTDKDKLSADHFAMIWEHYDTNGKSNIIITHSPHIHTACGSRPGRVL